MSTPRGILFTAFERSGDEHAAPVIEHIRQVAPEIPIYATGGLHMEAAGATLIERTEHMGAMGADSFSQVLDHLRRMKRLKRWLAEHPIAVHVPTDSPAANWGICKAVKKQFGDEAKVVHLVAPQVWAWGQWRVKRLRHGSDLVLCLLPFEPDWFKRHGVNARFIGHPVFDHPLDYDELNAQAAMYPHGSPKIALMPGSRSKELTRNWPVILDAWRHFAAAHPDASAVVAGINAEALPRLREIDGDIPDSVHMVHSQTDAIVRWADAVLSVSGTVSLHIARQAKPMVLLYKLNPVTWTLAGQFIVKARTFTLPNLIAAGRVEGAPPREHLVKEFVPWLGGSAQPIADALAHLVDHDKARHAQIDGLKKVIGHFAPHNAGKEAAQAILDMAGL